MIASCNSTKKVHKRNCYGNHSRNRLQQQVWEIQSFSKIQGRPVLNGQGKFFFFLTISPRQSLKCIFSKSVLFYKVIMQLHICYFFIAVEVHTKSEIIDECTHPQISAWPIQYRWVVLNGHRLVLNGHGYINRNLLHKTC